MNNALNKKLAQIEEALAVQERILDTYEGMVSFCNNGEGADHLFDHIDSIKANIATLNSEWNSLLIDAEAA
jgi:hypothetical protein